VETQAANLKKQTYDEELAKDSPAWARLALEVALQF
jgi:hypothetical protein